MQELVCTCVEIHIQSTTLKNVLTCGINFVVGFNCADIYTENDTNMRKSLSTLSIEEQFKLLEWTAVHHLDRLNALVTDFVSTTFVMSLCELFL